MRNIDNNDVYFSDMLLMFAIGILLGFLFGIAPSEIKFLSLGFGCIALFFSFSILRRGIK